MASSALPLFTTLVSLACAALLVAAAASDFAARLIPNRIPALLLVLGLALQLVQGTLIGGLLVALLVFAVLVVAWQFGVIGGGDVKLLAATALCVAPATVPLLIMRVGIAGGVLGVAYLMARRMVPMPVGAPRRETRSSWAALPGRILRAERWRIGRHAALPYGIAIAAGGLFTLI